jgi:poly(ADP-ribose) glycohydrolase ARH3
MGKTHEGLMRWTDDTQMSLDFAESLIANGRFNADDLALRFARSYRWSRGYGPATAKMLRRIARGMPWREAARSVHAEGSFGNGAAMRAAVGGLFYAARPEDLTRVAREAASITHAHPWGMEGAVLMAAATSKALVSADPLLIGEDAMMHGAQPPFLERWKVAHGWLKSKAAPGPDEVRARLRNGIAAHESCITALYLGLRFLNRPFLELLAFTAQCRGDVDTIGAMAGALWGTVNGANLLPAPALAKLEGHPRLRATAKALHTAACQATQPSLP